MPFYPMFTLAVGPQGTVTIAAPSNYPELYFAKRAAGPTTKATDVRTSFGHLVAWEFAAAGIESGLLASNPTRWCVKADTDLEVIKAIIIAAVASLDLELAPTFEMEPAPGIDALFDTGSGFATEIMGVVGLYAEASITITAKDDQLVIKLGGRFDEPGAVEGIVGFLNEDGATVTGWSGLQQTITVRSEGDPNEAGMALIDRLIKLSRQVNPEEALTLQDFATRFQLPEA